MFFTSSQTCISTSELEKKLEVYYTLIGCDTHSVLVIIAFDWSLVLFLMLAEVSVLLELAEREEDAFSIK